MPAAAMKRSGSVSCQCAAAARRSPSPPLTTPFTMFKRFISARQACRCAAPFFSVVAVPVTGLTSAVGKAASAG